MIMPSAHVVGIYSGGVETFIAPDRRSMTTGIRKRAFSQADLGPDGFIGDASTEADHHTTAKTVHLFPSAHYEKIEARLGTKLPRPTFGENLALTRMLEADVYVGDRYRIGQSVIEITQPTERCKAIGRSIGAPKILKVLHELEVCGFYARVITPGRVQVGDAVVLVARPQSDWSIQRLHRVMFNELADERQFALVLALPDLSADWKTRAAVMRERLRRGEPISSNVVDL